MTADPHWTAYLIRLGACSDAVEWAKSYPDLASAWAACEQPRWMMWLAGRVADFDSPERRALVLCLCEIARSVLHLIPHGEDRPRVAIETAEAWAHGGPDAPDTAQVQAAAYDAAYAAAYTEAAYAAADAAEAVQLAGTDTAESAAAAAVYAAADAVVLEIIRRHYPNPPRITP